MLKTEKNYIKKIENGLRNGNQLILMDIGEKLDPSLDPVLQFNIVKIGSQQFVKMGEQNVELNPNFKLFLITKLRNPNYLPEIATKVLVINFMITFDGLSD